MGPEKTPRNTVSTNTNIRSGGATGTTVRTTTPKAGTTGKSTKVTHEQIALRAREVWMKRGCRPGQDEQNWLEAERQLKAELGIK